MSTLRPSGLCSTCEHIIQTRPQDTNLKPFKTVQELLDAAELGCYICWTISHTKRWTESTPEAFQHGLHYNVLSRPDSRVHHRINPSDGLSEKLRRLDTAEAIEFLALNVRGGVCPKVPEGTYQWTFTRPGGARQLEPMKTQIGNHFSPKVPILQHLASGDQGPIFSLQRERWIGVGQAARRWIQSCDFNHPRCRPPNSLYRPTRLLEILNNQTVKLVHTSITATDRYAALSHCWGQTQTIKLQFDTRGEFERGIEVMSLPKSYQEAVLVCLKLDIGFIWIDSLCIFQDSKEDWEREAITMQDVYGNSYLNICTAAAANSTEESFLGRGRGVLRTPTVSTTWGKSLKDTFFLYYDQALHEDISETPLRYRAWVYQEWYLSPRSLILGQNQLWWHCREFLANEDYRFGNPEFQRFNWLKANNIDTPRSNEHDESMLKSFNFWFEHVEAFMKMNLSKESDRMIAFSGIVSSFGQSQKLTSAYLAGLWRVHLPLGLCWYVYRAKTSRSSRYIAPSWTWTSLLGPYQLGHVGHLWLSRMSEPGLLATLDSVSVISSDSSSNIGSIVGGAITVRGNITGPVTFRTHDGAIYLVDERNGEIYNNPQFDENDEDGPLITSMDSRPSEKGKGVFDGISRQVERPNNYAGSLSILPIAQMPIPMRYVYALILYQPLGESSVFYRVGYLTSIERSDTRGFHYRVTNSSYAKTLTTIL